MGPPLTDSCAHLEGTDSELSERHSASSVPPERVVRERHVGGFGGEPLWTSCTARLRSPGTNPNGSAQGRSASIHCVRASSQQLLEGSFKCKKGPRRGGGLGGVCAPPSCVADMGRQVELGAGFQGGSGKSMGILYKSATKLEPVKTFFFVYFGIDEDPCRGTVFLVIF